MALTLNSSGTITNSSGNLIQPTGAGVQLPNGLIPAYDSGWLYVSADDQTFTATHGLGRTPHFGIWMASKYGDSTNARSCVLGQGMHYSQGDDGSAMEFNNVRWRVSLDMDATYICYHNSGDLTVDGRTRMNNGPADGAGFYFRVLLY